MIDVLVSSRRWIATRERNPDARGTEAFRRVIAMDTAHTSGDCQKGCVDLRGEFSMAAAAAAAAAAAPAAASSQQPAAASITSEFQVPILALSVDRSQESMTVPSNTTASPAGMRNVLLFRRIIHLSVTHGRNPSIKASRASQAKQAKPSNPPIATFMRE
jgi:hypothetical protein